MIFFVLIKLGRRGPRFGVVVRSPEFFSLYAKAAQPRFWPVLARSGSGLGSELGLGLGLGLGLHPYLGPTRKCFLAREIRQYLNNLPPKSPNEHIVCDRSSRALATCSRNRSSRGLTPSWQALCAYFFVDW